MNTENNNNQHHHDKHQELINEFSLEFFIGLFFIVAVVILLYFTAVVNGKDLLGRAKYFIKVRFASVDILDVRAKVYLRGMPVGTVRKFNLDEDGQSVLVLMCLDEELTFYENYVIQIRSSSLLGGRYVHIDTGDTSKKTVPVNKILEGKPPLDILQDASMLIASLKEDEKIFRKEILNGETAKNIGMTLSDLQEIVNSLKTGKGTLGKLIEDPALYNDLKGSFENINILAKNAKDGKGTLGKLLSDDAAYDNLLAALQDLRTFAKSMAEGKGTMARIISDQGKLYDSLFAAVESIKVVSGKLAAGKGSLGKLMTDDELYNKTKATIDQLQGAVEDFREQAPIATFGSMVLGAL